MIAAATLLASTDVIGVERAADLMGALLKAPVSTGFVSRCLVRLDAALIAAGFEDALKDALRAADVLGTDETPAPLTTAATSAEGLREPARLHGADHARLYRRRAGPDLVRRGRATAPRRRSPGSGSWTATAGSWSATTTAATSATTPRSLESSSASPTCTGTSTTPTRSTRNPRSGPGRPATPSARPLPPSGPPAPPASANLDPALLARLRHSYDQAVACGISVNLSRPWHKGNHPGLILARRLKRKAAQVWLFATRFDVPATNNGSENAVRGYKLAAKISGCWRTLSTLQRHCRIRSYLTTARSHGRHPLAARVTATTVSAVFRSADSLSAQSRAF